MRFFFLRNKPTTKEKMKDYRKQKRLRVKKIKDNKHSHFSTTTSKFCKIQLSKLEIKCLVMEFEP